jgi:hypothetical protein
MKINRYWLWSIGVVVWLMPVIAGLTMLVPSKASAAEAGDFTIQVSPSPLVITLKPGTTQTATLTIRNQSNHEETLTPALTAVKVGSSSTDVSLGDTPPPEIRDWVSFDQSSLTLGAGTTKQLNVIYKTPANVGFSYITAITLNRAGNTLTTNNGASYKASVAVFNLMNIDRTGAYRELKIERFATEKSRYEFLPAQFSLKVRNTGNVTVQPAGTLFIQRSFDSNTPLATIPINRGGGYILPENTRTFDAKWDKGFPAYTTANIDGKTETTLSWDWKHIGDLRFGKYVAKIVLVYNDGQRDIPVVASVSFWVIPWRIILVGLLLIVVVVTGIVGWGKIIARGTGKLRKKYAAYKR